MSKLIYDDKVKSVSFVYEGEWTDKIPNGTGTLIDGDENKYVGEFLNGVYEGEGTITYKNGDKYLGQFKDNGYEGEGTWTHPDGSKYVGEYKKGKKHYFILISRIESIFLVNSSIFCII